MGLLGEGGDTVKRFECVDDQKAAGFPVTAACEAAEVSTSGYYDWKTRQHDGLSARQVADDELVELMQEIFAASDGNYGVPRMYRQLRLDGHKVNKKRVHRLMRANGMVGRFTRRRVQTTFHGPTGFKIPDLLTRAFQPGRPNVAWCQDITYIQTLEGWLFVASVIDVGSRRLIGYSMNDHMRTELVTNALRMAIDARAGNVCGVISHADRGSQYTSIDYLNFCADHGLRPSVGRTAVCWDNALAESFWASLKRECVKGQIFKTRAEARQAIFKWINWYNNKRLHTSLNTTPTAWEQAYQKAS